MPNHHLDLLRNSGGLDSLGRSLLDRASGRFYTPPLIGQRLARATLDAFPEGSTTVRVVDPFCGDGRLVAQLIASTAESPPRRRVKWQIELWDTDADAVYQARREVSVAAEQAGIDATIRALVVDTFAHGPSRFGEFDVVITNPPWDVLKPDRRELASLSPLDAAAYVQALRAYSDRLEAAYPTSLPRRLFSGWGINLARCGVEVALRLTAHGGSCGVVSPASLFADQSSIALRRWIFKSSNLVALAYYPAESRLFVGVDQPAIAFAATATPGRDINIEMTRFGSDRAQEEQWQLTKTASDLASDGYALPIHVGKDLGRIIGRVRHLPRFGELESRDVRGLWAGREIDETDLHGSLSDDGPHPFVKGRMITRFGFAYRPTQAIDESVKPIPRSSEFARIAWRDVSRPTQPRRMQATIIPAGWVSGNSLSVAHFRDGDVVRLKALLAVLNSSVFECQVRANLATAHVSLSTVRICHVPILDRETSESLARLVDRRLAGDAEVEQEIDNLVAKSYGVGDEIGTIRALLVGRAGVELEAAS